MKKYFWLFNINYKRHLLLKYLSLRNIEYWQKQKGYTYPYMTFNEICGKLKWNKTELDVVYLHLENQKEIEQNVEKLNNILTITEKGILSFSNLKYYNVFLKSLINGLKHFVQIFIPIGTILIAFIALNNNKPKEFYKEKKNGININAKQDR